MGWLPYTDWLLFIVPNATKHRPTNHTIRVPVSMSLSASQDYSYNGGSCPPPFVLVRLQFLSLLDNVDDCSISKNFETIFSFKVIMLL